MATSAEAVLWLVALGLKILEGLVAGEQHADATEQNEHVAVLPRFRRLHASVQWRSKQGRDTT